MGGASAKAPGPGAYRPSGFFALRTPLLPAGTLLGVAGEPGPRPADAAALDEALGRERGETVARLRAAVAAPEVREAIFVASPSLAAALGRAPELGDEAAGKVDQAAYRYLARMSTRSTPFGLFAGCSVGDVGKSTALELAPRASYRRHVRPDMLALCTVVEALASNPETRGALRYVKNPSIYPAGGRLRYSQLSLVGEETYPLVDVAPTEHLSLALRAAEAPSSVGELVAAVRAEYPEVGEDEASGFVEALIDNGLLVPALVPTVTGPEPTGAFLAELGRSPPLGPFRDALAAACGALGRAESAALGASVGHYREAIGALSSVCPGLDQQRAYQVDLVKPLARGSLGGPVVDEMLRAASLLATRARPKPAEVIARLMARFVARYEDREVPLVEALDDDIGVGFEEGAEDATPLLENLVMRGRGAKGRDRKPAGEGSERDPEFEAALRDKLHRALRTGGREIELGAGDFGPPAKGPGPDAFAVFATVTARSGLAVDRGEFELFWPRVIAPSGVAILGRFCHADPELEARLRGHLAAEDALSGDAVLADVVHLPSGRLGNIMLRPVLRPYEVVCNGRSGAEPARQLPASDLLLSARGGRFVVRSRRLGRRVLPRVTNAHNVPADVTANVYRFLYALQAENVGGGGFDWGALADSEYLPRVRSGRIVFSPASWRLGRERLSALEGAPAARQFSALRALRDELGVPRWVAVAQSDNVLPLDLENPFCVETFAQLVKGQASVRLIEFDHAPGLVTGPEGGYAHEFVVPFVRQADAPAGGAKAAPAAPSTAPVVTSAAPSPPRAEAAPAAEAPPFAPVVAPGADVLYAKLYGAPSGVDALVREVAAPLARRALDAGAARGWFFVRYRDSDHHLRLRFFGERARLWGEVLPALHEAVEPLLASGRVAKLQLDTYEREVDRYGGPAGVQLAERLFCADSEACVAILEGLEDEAERWQAVALGVDALLRDFGLDGPARLAFARRSADGLGTEFGLDDAAVRRSVEAKVRELGPRAEALVRGELGPLAGAAEAFERRSEANAPIVAALRAGRDRGEVGGDEGSRLWSYAHMHANRLFVASPRLQELVLYHLLARAYRADLGRSAARKP
jgi:class I lanthipeptide synthase